MDVAPRPAEESLPDGFCRRLRHARRGKREAALEVVARVLKQQDRADGFVDDLVDAFIGAFLEREVEERRDPPTFRLRAGVAQRQNPRVARLVGADEDDIVETQVAAGFCECGDARLIGHAATRSVRLKRREAGRVRLAGVEIAKIDDLAGLLDGRAVKTESGQPVLAGIGEGGEDLAVVRHHRRHAELVGHHMRPRARRSVGQMQRPAGLAKNTR